MRFIQLACTAIVIYVVIAWQATGSPENTTTILWAIHDLITDAGDQAHDYSEFSGSGGSFAKEKDANAPRPLGELSPAPLGASRW